MDLLKSLPFWGIGPILWTSGLWLFMKSALSPVKKVVWALVLIAIGAMVGSLLTMSMIRDRFLLLLLALPVPALVDITLGRSKRSFLFWFRACAFEICTVFGTAAMVRYLWRETRSGSTTKTELRPRMNGI
jgi:hypothetical protein